MHGDRKIAMLSNTTIGSDLLELCYPEYLQMEIQNGNWSKIFGTHQKIQNSNQRFKAIKIAINVLLKSLIRLLRNLTVI